MPEPSVAYLGMLYWSCGPGYAASVAGDFEALTGRKPMTFEAFARVAAAVMALTDRTVRSCRTPSKERG